MFTGLVEKTGKLVQLEAARIAVTAGAWDAPLKEGESLAVSGVCLTLAGADHSAMWFDVLEETLQRTNLGEKKAGDRLNLERALRAGDRLGGHMVTGHVDGIGRVESLVPRGADWVLEVSVEPRLAGDMVLKGSVACDGVSLTIAGLEDNRFSVHLIPVTWKHTALSDLKPGDPVNVETDVVGKYVRRFLETGASRGRITEEVLKKFGYE